MTYIERMEAELQALQAKCTGAVNYLAVNDDSLLAEQLDYMTSYAKVLRQRIEKA